MSSHSPPHPQPQPQTSKCLPYFFPPPLIFALCILSLPGRHACGFVIIALESFFLFLHSSLPFCSHTCTVRTQLGASHSHPFSFSLRSLLGHFFYFFCLIKASDQKQMSKRVRKGKIEVTASLRSNETQCAKVLYNCFIDLFIFITVCVFTCFYFCIIHPSIF